MKDITLTILAFCIGVILLYIAIAISAGPTEAETSNAIIHEDVIIFPDEITGLGIQKYAVASLGEQQWMYILKISGTEQEIRFETREEAESFMLFLSQQAGNRL